VKCDSVENDEVIDFQHHRLPIFQR